MMLSLILFLTTQMHRAIAWMKRSAVRLKTEKASSLTLKIK